MYSCNVELPKVKTENASMFSFLQTEKKEDIVDQTASNVVKIRRKPSPGVFISTALSMRPSLFLISRFLLVRHTSGSGLNSQYSTDKKEKNKKRVRRKEKQKRIKGRRRKNMLTPLLLLMVLMTMMMMTKIAMLMTPAERKTW